MTGNSLLRAAWRMNKTVPVLLLLLLLIDIGAWAGLRFRMTPRLEALEPLGYSCAGVVTAVGAGAVRERLFAVRQEQGGGLTLPAFKQLVRDQFLMLLRAWATPQSAPARRAPPPRATGGASRSATSPSRA